MFLIFLCIFALTFHKCQIVMKAILSFFLLIFWLFLIFLFIFALTFHKCHIVKKAILSFLFFALFLKVCWAPRCSFFRWAFCVRFCLCFLFFSGFVGFLATTGRRGAEAYDSGRGADYRGGKAYDSGRGLITGAGKAYDSGRGLITAAGEACDSGREAHYWGGKGL